VTHLERELEQLGRHRYEQRRRRVAGPQPIVAVVGYTNAGKSTLLNALTGAGVLAEDKLFATLDPRARRLRLPGGGFAVLTDTVGFIRDMPQDLFAAFRATFDEAADADLLLHVLDVSSPEAWDQERATEEILERLDLTQKPRLTVLNKADLLVTPPPRPSDGENSLFVSATGGAGIARLLARIEQCLSGSIGAAHGTPAANGASADAPHAPKLDDDAEPDATELDAEPDATELDNDALLNGEPFQFDRY
jgi:GTP-binding protein HflX